MQNDPDYGGDPFDEQSDSLGDDRDSERDEPGFAQRVIPDVVRKALLTGMGAVLMGEEGLRGAVSDMKMPKDAAGYLLGQADKTKDALVKALAGELRQFLDSLDLQSILEKSLTGTTIEIQTTVRVIPKEEGGVGLEVLDNDTQVTRASDRAGEDEPAKKKTKRKRTPRKKKSSASAD